MQIVLPIKIEIEVTWNEDGETKSRRDRLKEYKELPEGGMTYTFVRGEPLTLQVDHEVFNVQNASRQTYRVG